MSWKAVGPIVEKVVNRIVDTGEDAAGTASRRQKGADPEGPAKFTGQRLREGEALADTANPGQEGFRVLPGGRCMDRANPTRVPRAARSIHLRLVVSG